MDRIPAMVCLVGLIALVGCGGSPPRSTGVEPSDPAACAPPAARQEGATEVVLLGTLHGPHRTSARFSLNVIERTVRAIRPDVVLVEIPPARFDRVVAEVDAAATDGQVDRDELHDSWIRAFPEIYAVLLPLRHELRYDVVPVSGFRTVVGQDRKRYYASHPQGPDDGTYRDAQRAFDDALEQHDATENPCWVNSPEYRATSGKARRALAAAADHELGEAAVMRINEAHVSRVIEAIETHRGKRILVVFGARHAWYMLPAIQERASAHHLLDVRPFLPTGACACP